MKKNLVIDKYRYFTAKGLKPNEEKEILELADLHIGKNTMNKYGEESINLLYKYLEDKEKIDAIIVPGDHVNGANSYLNDEYMKKLNYVLEMLGEKAPTILSKGNHDIWNDNYGISKLYKEVGNLKNVYALDNEQVTINDISFTGFSPRFKAYDIMNIGQKASDMFIEDYKKCNFKYEDGKLNILLTHDPLTISSLDAISALNEDLKNITLVASGHLHNGFITTKHELRSKYKLQDRGYIESPLTLFRTGSCRGARLIGGLQKGQVYLPDDEYETIIDGRNQKDKALLVVTKGFSKYPLSKIGGDPNITEISLSSLFCYSDKDKNKKAKVI